MLYWLLCIKLKYSEYNFSYTILQCEPYQDPGNINIIVDSAITTTYSHDFDIHKILSILVYSQCFLSIYVNDRKFVHKNVHRGRTYDKSRNIALITKIVTFHINFT